MSESIDKKAKHLLDKGCLTNFDDKYETMPTPAENINAFDLKLLKALLNFKIKKKHTQDLNAKEKRPLCKSYGKKDGITISHAYIVKIWPKKNEFPHTLEETTLSQFCSILRKDYTWSIFVNDISILRPTGIPDGKVYSKLDTQKKEKIDTAIDEIFGRYKRFEDFESEIIDKIVKQIPEQETKIKHQAISIQGEKADQELKQFAKRIYIELATRKAAIPIDEDNDVIEEVYNSWYKLFCAIRDELKTAPIKDINNPESPVGLAMKILNDALRPHLTEHQAKYRSWLETAKKNPKNKNCTPQELQKKYASYKELMNSIGYVNNRLISITAQISCLL
jgi:hypothetical protein